MKATGATGSGERLVSCGEALYLLLAMVKGFGQVIYISFYFSRNHFMCIAFKILNGYIHICRVMYVNPLAISQSQPNGLTSPSSLIYINT